MDKPSGTDRVGVLGGDERVVGDDDGGQDDADGGGDKRETSHCHNLWRPKRGTAAHW